MIKQIDKNTELIISGYDKEEVNNFAAIIRNKRPPEPYRGKGIRYFDEKIKLKEGKKGKQMLKTIDVFGLFYRLENIVQII